MSHARGALLELGVLVVRMLLLRLLVMVSMLAAAIAAIVRHQRLIRLQRVLVGITEVGKGVDYVLPLTGLMLPFTHLLSVLGC